jgi:hypothetical protein
LLALLGAHHIRHISRIRVNIIVDVVFVVNDYQFVCLSDIVVPVLSMFLVCP